MRATLLVIALAVSTPVMAQSTFDSSVYGPQSGYYRPNSGGGYYDTYQSPQRQYYYGGFDIYNYQRREAERDY